MKAIRILAVLALVMFLVAEFGDAAKGLVEGWNQDTENAAMTLQNPIEFRVDAKNILALDTLRNQADGKSLPYVMTGVNLDRLQYPSWSVWSLFLVLPFVLLAFYGFYCVLRLIYSVLRGEVFTKLNVHRMRFFVYSLLAAGVVMELQQWAIYEYMASQVVLEGYKVVGYTLEYPWFSYLLLALFTEIFAVGVKLKEEQDLTI